MSDATRSTTTANDETLAELISSAQHRIVAPSSVFIRAIAEKVVATHSKAGG